MEKRNIIVIGASAGGFEGLKKIVAGLPPNLDASIFVVWHIAPDVRGVLPQVLNNIQTLHGAHAVDMEPIKRGRIYVAPPDHHLLIEKGWVRITRGPKENRFRPAVDPLFRSAAYAYRSQVIGVILSGALDDGTAGLWAIKNYGGIAIVQDPEEAEVPSMPENAIRAVEVDYKLRVADIPSALVKLVQEEVRTGAPAHGNGKVDESRIKTEINIAMEDSALNDKVLQLGKLTPYTCPECHGVLSALVEGGRVRFRCHTGHAFSADSLLATISESIEESLWSAIRSIQESVMLLNHMGDHFAEVNQPKVAAMYFKKAKEAEGRANSVRQAVLNHEQLSTDSILHEANTTESESDE
ncbi:chemotaxis protein CheB [Chryseosolibacter indicus]|uniref:protein-glutamate methylesterase n=1 Tax=Chryseosolibacter indicus TaxID=2782351 RepID=A0ABS5VYZ2_9BACT|nr:chemotaxis protein CheB [Chryseosolibacter indicus]MBT1706085.1 chemotaxis protein CheB [Chryseosolibacter indicus]